MAGTDRVQFSTLQQLTGSDLNANQQLAGRLTADAYRFLLQTVSAEVSGTAPVETSRGAVLGGLNATTDGSVIQVGAGVLAQPDWGISPAPAPRESAFLLGRDPGGTQVPIAVPGSDSWHVVQARVQETSVVTQTRNVWNPGLDAFAAQVVTTEVTLGVEYNVKVLAGTELPLPDNGWVPICGVFRDAAGSSITQADIIDLRPLPGETFGRVDDGSEEVLWMDVLTNQFVDTGAPTTVGLDLGVVANGRRLFMRPSGDPFSFVDIANPPYKRLAGAPANSWHYLYLADWAGTTPRGQYAAFRSQGVLVVSTIPTAAQGSRRNGSPIVLPSPFQSYTVPAGEAVALGAVRRNAAGTGWDLIAIRDGRTQSLGANVPRVPGFQASPLTISDADWPTNARTLDLLWRNSDTAGYTSSALTVQDAATSGTVLNITTDTIAGTSPFAFRGVPLTLDGFSGDLELTWATGDTGTAVVDGLGF